MRKVSFSEVKEEIIRNMQRNMLIPVIGSGFTKGCQARGGVVPSGSEYRKYMIDQIINIHKTPLSQKDIVNLREMPFSDVSEIYQDVVPIDEQRKYLRQNFTRVSIEKVKSEFLSYNWPYIYTLNIDDGIEGNSDYKHVVYSNRIVEDNVFDEERCVIKLHGDISEMLTYRDSDSEIFTRRQYVSSLKKNTHLLSKMKHDSEYQNLIFIGCSLDDEIDLLAYSGDIDEHDRISSKYICVVGEPTSLETLRYEKYGITHCVLFQSYDDIYHEIYSAGQEALKISADDLDHYKSFTIERLTADYNENKPYLFFGKSLIDKDCKITIPYFFVPRKATSGIINNIDKYPVQFLIGSGCSGKTYVLVDIASKIRNRDVFFFQTKDRLTEKAFKKLNEKERCVIIADNAALSSQQIEYYLGNAQSLREKGINVIIAVDKNNRDLHGILKLYELQGKTQAGDFPQIPLDNKLNKEELDLINPLLTMIDVGIFDRKKTLADNIIAVSKSLTEKNKFYNVLPRWSSVWELAALISLATERKIYSSRAAKLELIDEMTLQCKAATPLIDYESTWSFETNASDNSPIKYVVNADYWLCYQLKRFTDDKDNYKRIVEAYTYIVGQIIDQEGKPDLLSGNREASYKDYILFDNINRIFGLNQASRRSGLTLIREIYEGLNQLLSVDPNYMHQRAKCFIKSAYFEKELENKNEFLDKAFRDANVAEQIFRQRYEECENEKILISIAHVKYTLALVWCHKCYIKDYSNIDDNTNAIQLLHEALISPYNSYDFAQKDAFNYNNVIGKIIYRIVSNITLIKDDEQSELMELYSLISK